MKIVTDKINELEKMNVELDDIESDDPVIQLTLGWRITNGRKIYGLQYEGNIEAIICVAYMDEVPELEN